MKKLLVTALAASLGFAATASANTVTINIVKIGEEGGDIYVRLYKASEKDGYPKEPTALQARVKVNGSDTKAVFNNVEAGKYAVAMFQDVNGNGEIDTNFIGKPTEPVGYTGEKQFLKPSFDGASFDVNGDIEVTSTFH